MYGHNVRTSGFNKRVKAEHSILIKTNPFFCGDSGLSGATGLIDPNRFQSQLLGKITINLGLKKNKKLRSPYAQY